MLLLCRHTGEERSLGTRQGGALSPRATRNTWGPGSVGGGGEPAAATATGGATLAIFKLSVAVAAATVLTATRGPRGTGALRPRLKEVMEAAGAAESSATHMSQPGRVTPQTPILYIYTNTHSSSSTRSTDLPPLRPPHRLLHVSTRHRSTRWAPAGWSAWRAAVWSARDRCKQTSTVQV